MERFVRKLLFVTLVFPSALDACDRLYVGSVNETFPELVHNNGIYIQSGSDYRGRPIFKHEFRDNYLYFIGGNLMSGFWAVGPEAGGTDAALSVQTGAPNPALAPRHWKLWDDADQRWREDRRVRATCVPTSFVTCTTGRVRLTGISPWNHHQRELMGDYVLTNTTEQMRPVYRHTESNNFLFHYDGLWMVGPEAGRITAGMFVLDSAWRPEYIIEDWVVFNGHQFVRDQRVTITCQGVTLEPAEGGNHSDIPEDITGNMPGNIPAADPGPLPLCPSDWCHNGGSCIKNANDTYLCACPEGFFGTRCEQEIRCGPPPEVEHGTLLSSTGSHHGAIAFYNCNPDYVISGQPAAVCREDGEWSEAPSCEHRFHQITPSVPVRRLSHVRAFLRSRGGRRP